MCTHTLQEKYIRSAAALLPKILDSRFCGDAQHDTSSNLDIPILQETKYWAIYYISHVSNNSAHVQIQIFGIFAVIWTYLTVCDDSLIVTRKRFTSFRNQG